MVDDLENDAPPESEVEAPATVSGNLSDDPNEMAATLLHLYTPKYNALVDKLSSKAMRRLLKKLPVYPLNEKAYEGTTLEEKNAFAIAERLIESKFVLQMGSYQKLIEKQEAAPETPAVENNITETKE